MRSAGPAGPTGVGTVGGGDATTTAVVIRGVKFVAGEDRVPVMGQRADLHLHTRHSSRATDWLLRKVDFPASCSDPRGLYRELRGRGFDFVTFTDHDTIDGCLEIAGEADAFISEEITAFFPEDDVKVHVLAWGITESQHAEIQVLRRNIYELARWLKAQGIAHAVAHPFWPVDERLSVDHWERLILLFRHFETVNGLRDPLLGQTAEFEIGRAHV